jgi:hypothetical protein
MMHPQALRSLLSNSTSLVGIDGCIETNEIATLIRNPGMPARIRYLQQGGPVRLTSCHGAHYI